MEQEAHSPAAAADANTIAKLLFGILVLTLIGVLAQGWQIARGMSVKSQSWEYLIDGPLDEELQGRLQSLGSAGWELVSARRATTERNGESQGIYEMIFRRPAEEPALPVAPAPR